MKLIMWVIQFPVMILEYISGVKFLTHFKGHIDHNALASIISFNLPYLPPQQLCTNGFPVVNLSVFHKVLVLSLMERVE